ncbi:MAG: ATP-binding protein [Blastocatellia bacterium]
MPNDRRALPRVAQRIQAFILAQQLPLSLLPDFLLAAEEALMNVISYGYSDNETHLIQLRLQCTKQVLRLRIEDDGRPFNPLTRPLPDVTIALQTRAVGGLGIHLVRQLMDQVEYQRTAGSNILTLTKNLFPLGTERDGMP